MMKTKLLIFLLLATVALNAAWIDIYKRGPIRLIPDPSFGKGTDWEELFYDEFKSLVRLPDGSIFVSNMKQHNISKFSPEGKFLSRFGVLGNGPGDLYGPGVPVIFGNRYIAIGEYAETRRISIFDFSGKCVKIVRTTHPDFYTTALKDNKIVYSYSRNDKNIKKRDSEKTVIMSVDVETGKERELMMIEVPLKTNPGTKWVASQTFGDVYYTATKDGNLLIGASHLPYLKIYSPEGKLIREFALNLKQLPTTAEYKKKREESHIKMMKEFKNKRPADYENLKNAPAPPKWDYLPYYDAIIVDSEGNILVFKKQYCLEKCMKTFQVYSPEGKYICETLIDEGILAFHFEQSRRNILFTDKGIFGLFSVRNSEDVSLRLVKVNL
jgi:hypothetical protein